MRITKVLCDRCKCEVNYPQERRIHLCNNEREYDFCNKCYWELHHWFYEPDKYKFQKESEKEI